MTEIDLPALEEALEALPRRFSGPGGAAGVVKDGEIIAARAWGFADLDAHRPFTAATRFPICSISKQFTCGALLGAMGEPEALDSRLAAHLPNFRDPLPKIRDLCNNQSGLRDYWALTVLLGAKAEQSFRREDAARVFAKMETGHFAPGAHYSYSNGNFRLIADLLEQEAGETLEALCARHIWGPAGMKTASWDSESRHKPEGLVGYEGDEANGYLPAENGIWWIGDAGMAASLEDMLAYERWIDRTRDDPQGLYRRLSEPQSFRDGSEAHYGFGLAYSKIGGLRCTGHGGALRGFRSNRLHCAEARLSAVVFFNHGAEAHLATAALMRAALGVRDEPPAPLSEGWEGQWLCAGTDLVAQAKRHGEAVLMRFGKNYAEPLFGKSEDEIAGPQAVLTRKGGEILQRRPTENFAAPLKPLAPAPDSVDGAEIAGRYRSEELDAEMTVESRDGGFYAWFEGLLGRGKPEILRPAGPDVWTLVTRRSMDASPPGDWTLILRRDAAGRVEGARLGCWLARRTDWRKIA